MPGRLMPHKSIRVVRFSCLKNPKRCRAPIATALHKKTYAPYLRMVAFLLITVGNVVAQDSRCTLKLSDLPQAAELSGFRIGMTTDQVKARVPQVLFGRTD